MQGFIELHVITSGELCLLGLPAYRPYIPSYFQQRYGFHAGTPRNVQCLNSADDGPTWGRPQTEKDVNVTGDRATARQHSGVMFDNTHYTSGWFYA